MQYNSRASGITLAAKYRDCLSSIAWLVLPFKPRSSPRRFASDTITNVGNPLLLGKGVGRLRVREMGFLFLRQKLSEDQLNQRKILLSHSPLILHLKTIGADRLRNGTAVVSALCT